MIKILSITILLLQLQTKDCVECFEDLAIINKNYAVVCGEDGVTYLNECFAKCNNTKVDFNGKCARSQCLGYNYPVCTTQGNTWANECEANYHGEAILYQGYCGQFRNLRLPGYNRGLN